MIEFLAGLALGFLIAGAFIFGVVFYLGYKMWNRT